MATCGTGGWSGPLPGDPDNNVLLSATPIFGGVVVSWTFPTTYPHAVAHVLVYRGTTLNYAASIKIATTHSSQFFDENLGTTDIQYYYWIQIVSINGTVGDAIGPATALSRPSITTIIEQLTGKIEDGALSHALKQEIDKITLLSQGLTAEELARIAANSALGALIAELQTNTDTAIADLLAGILAQTNGLIQESLDRAAADIDEASSRIEAVTLESIARNAQVQATAYAALEATLAANGIQATVQGDIALAKSELSQDLQTGISAEAALRTILAAKLDTDIGTTLTAITNEATARSTGDAAEATARGILSSQILGADGTSLTQGLIFQERNTRATEDLALAQQITLLSAGAGEQFDWQSIWYFDTGIESWSGNGTPTATAGWLRPADQGSGAYVNSPVGIAAEGAKYGQVRLRIRKTGTPTFAGWLYWQGTLDSTWDNARRIALPEPTYDVNGIGLITVSPAWGAVTVNTIRVDLSSAQTVGNYYELDWVAVGRPSPGASSAQLYTEQTVRANADSALTTSISTLSSQVNNVTNGLPATYAAVITEQTTRATADTANANSITALSAQVNHVTTGLPATLAAVSTEQTARANADTAIASSVTLLSSQVNDVSTGLPQTRADLIVTQNTLATATAASVSEIRSLKVQTDGISEAALRNLFVNSDTRTEFTGTLAIATQELRAEMVAGVSAEASARLTLAAVVDSAVAGLVTEQTARVNADGALTTSLTNLTATVSGNSAAISNEQTTRANADSAMASDIAALVVSTGNNAAAITATNTAWALADEAVALTVTNLSSTVSTNQSTLVSNYYTKAATDSAISSAGVTLKTAMEGPAGSIGLIGSDLINNYYTKTVTDSTIAQAGTQLRSYADIGVKSFNQATAPTKRGVNTTVTPNVDVALVIGDVWVDTDDHVRYNWNGSAWVVASDTAQFDAWVAGTYATNLADITDNKIESWFATSDPSAGWTGTNASHTGDFWYNSTTKLLKRWSGIAWVTIEDKAAIDAAAAASTAQSTADGKITTFVSTSAPTAQSLGDLWIDSDDQNKMYRWSGSAWVVIRDTSASAQITTLEQTKIGYSTKAGVVFDNGGLIVDKTGVDSWNAGHPSDLAVWNIGLPLATAVKQVSVTDPNTGTATVEQAFTAQKALNDALKVQYTVKLSVNAANGDKMIGGFGVYGDATGIEAGFDVDRFWIGRSVLNPGTGLFTKVKPFIVDGTDVIIDNAVIRNLSASHINTNGLTIRDNSGNIILNAGSSTFLGNILNSSGGTILNSSNTSNQIFNSNVTLGVDGASGRISLDGAGGGSVNGIVMPGYPITGGNIGTYISSAAIGTAYIGDAAITSAKIGDLQVGTLKIGVDAVTVASVGTFSSQSGNGAWQTAGGVGVFNDTSGTKMLLTFTCSLTYSAGLRTTQFVIEHWFWTGSGFAQNPNIYDSGPISGAYVPMPAGSALVTSIGITSHIFILKWYGQDTGVVLLSGSISAVGVKR